MSKDSKSSRQDTAVLIQNWATAGSDRVSADFEFILQDLVRRRIGDLLLEEGLWSPIDVERIAHDVVDDLGVTLSLPQQTLLRNAAIIIGKKILVDDDPKEVTRWIWMWDPEDSQNAPYVEEHLFRAINVELRTRISRILHRANFGVMKYKIDQAELVSELYIKLKHSGTPRLPANRRQFFALVDKAIESILFDMQKASLRMKRPHTGLREPLVDVHQDQRQNPLQTLLDAEDPALHNEKRLRLERHLKALPPRQQEVFRLKINGNTLEEISGIIDCSLATVKRDHSKAIAHLTIEMSKPE